MLLIILLYFFLKKLFNPLHCLVNYCKHFSQEDTSLPPCDGSYEIQSLRLAIISLVEKNQNLVNSERDIFKEAAHEIKSPVAILKTRIDLFKHDSSYTRAEFSKEAQDDINTITRYLKELLFLKSVERDLLEEKKFLTLKINVHFCKTNLNLLSNKSNFIFMPYVMEILSLIPNLKHCNVYY